MVDRIDAVEYASYFTQDGQVIFGNQPPITGKADIQKAMQAFYDSLSAMHHQIENLWVHPGTVVSQAVAHYTRKDGKTVDLPVVTVINLRGDKVHKVQFYMDITPLNA
jgi:ketosteroid isomerase-like protein